MNPQFENLQIEIEKALEAIPPELASCIRPVLAANLDRGRVEYFVGDDFARVGEYVQRVVDHYERLSPYIKAVQKNKSDDVWLPLFKNLQTWAYNFLLRKNFYPSPETQVIAEECAAEAAMHLLDAHFPYDTDFEPWAHTIITKTCLHYFRDETKKSVIPAKNLTELDETQPDLNAVAFMEQDISGNLLEVLSQLSDARCQVLQLHYLKNMSLPEIAKVLGKSLGAVYSLHFNALEDLRKILGKNRNNT